MGQEKRRENKVNKHKNLGHFVNVINMAQNINKKLWTADNGRCSTFGDFYEEPKSRRLKRHQLMAFRVSGLDSCFRTNLTKEKNIRAGTLESEEPL